MSEKQTSKARGDILIVDDALPNLRLLSRMLQDNDYQVRGISNSAMVTTVVNAEPPDLILLDINMPGQNGYEVCRSLKANEASRTIPVIFISALDDVIDKVQAFSVGGVDYITKPFQVEEVLARVETHLTIRTLQKQLEKQVRDLQSTTNDLVAANKELQASNDELNAFAHTVAHDLKNPLASTLLSMDLLERFIQLDMHEKALSALVNIRDGGYKLTNIIDELLLLASVRKETVEKAPLDMGEVVEQAIDRLNMMFIKQDVKIDLPDEWPVAVGYAPWVEEVWVNYMSNAIKYGGSPPAMVCGTTVQENGMVKFWIKDNGDGISNEVINTLFTEFTRLGRVRVQGHGLGLSIVKRIIEKLDGEVGLESQVGEGSTFFFTLPAG
ncbi:MAG: hybrid sensor histidine kinase/response regulator [Anaerolineae bacterium]|nr:hybrid sensor histidine kinase/response regulator [Anaerolineae bacterium]